MVAKSTKSTAPEHVALAEEARIAEEKAADARKEAEIAKASDASTAFGTVNETFGWVEQPLIEQDDHVVNKIKVPKTEKKAE